MGDIFKSVSRIRHHLLAHYRCLQLFYCYTMALERKAVEKVECNDDVRTEGKGFKIRVPFPTMGATT